MYIPLQYNCSIHLCWFLAECHWGSICRISAGCLWPGANESGMFYGFYGTSARRGHDPHAQSSAKGSTTMWFPAAAHFGKSSFASIRTIRTSELLDLSMLFHDWNVCFPTPLCLWLRHPWARLVAMWKHSASVSSSISTSLSKQCIKGEKRDLRRSQNRPEKHKVAGSSQKAQGFKLSPPRPPHPALHDGCWNLAWARSAVLLGGTACPFKVPT